VNIYWNHYFSDTKKKPSSTFSYSFFKQVTSDARASISAHTAHRKKVTDPTGKFLSNYLLGGLNPWLEENGKWLSDTTTVAKNQTKITIKYHLSLSENGEKN